MTHTKGEYARLKADGVCVDCQKAKALKGHVHCAECLEARNRWAVQRRAMKRKDGVCGYNYCNEPIGKNSTWLCDKHAEMKRIQGINYRKRAKEAKYGKL
mgnify:CR=1 FL=1